jgi:hypothetical protein
MRAARILKVVLLVAGITALMSFFVLRLWNWLMPEVFGLHLITFGQALGLLVLSKILFSGFRGFRGGFGPRMWQRRMMERWEKMTPEEREKFRQGLAGRCGPFASPSAEPKS